MSRKRTSVLTFAMWLAVVLFAAKVLVDILRPQVEIVERTWRWS